MYVCTVIVSVHTCLKTEAPIALGQSTKTNKHNAITKQLSIHDIWSMLGSSCQALTSQLAEAGLAWETVPISLISHPVQIYMFPTEHIIGIYIFPIAHLVGIYPFSHCPPSRDVPLSHSSYHLSFHSYEHLLFSHD